MAKGGILSPEVTNRTQSAGTVLSFAPKSSTGWAVPTNGDMERKGGKERRGVRLLPHTTGKTPLRAHEGG